jgi:hypothetical protein
MAVLFMQLRLQLLKIDPDVVQLTLPMAWQLMSQLAFAWAVQLPWHSALHWAEQVAVGGRTLQLALQRAEQLALHCPMHVSMSLEPVQEPEQEPVQLALQLVLQSISPGVPVQPPLQPAVQLPVQLAEADTLQPPEQLASRLASHATWRLGGEHAALHPPLIIAVHDSLPLKTAPPQSLKMSARAELAANVSVAPATRARSEDQRNMRDLRGSNVSLMRRVRSRFPSTVTRCTMFPPTCRFT